MSKALLGSHVDGRTLALLDEVRALRSRVADLERALEEAEEAARRNDAARRAADIVLETTSA